MMSYEVVLFDEEENPEVFTPDLVVLPIVNVPTLPAASRTRTSDESQFPENTNGAVAGWMYFNFHNGAHATIASQNWVTVSMQSEDRFSLDHDAVALGNGCTPVRATTEAIWNARGGSPPIGPAPNVNP